MFKYKLYWVGLLAASVGGVSKMVQNPKSIIYSFFIMPFLKKLDPETAHRIAILAAHYGIAPKSSRDDPILATTCFGRHFSNPIGIAAGFDKHGEAIAGLFHMGFGFVEIGSVCPLPQPGNPKPRLFRLLEDQAIINRYGFNSDGADKVRARLIQWRESQKRDNPIERVVGVNLGVQKLGPLADYIVINVSSPNTPNLRDLQEESALKSLIMNVQITRDDTCPNTPVLIKIAPDLTDLQKSQIAAVATYTAVDGIIVSNTTISRSPELISGHKDEIGGLSGKPLFDSSTKLLQEMYELTSGRITLIGVGGISSGEDALKKIKAGASLLQLYTVLAVKGPVSIEQIKEELTLLLKREGFNNVSEAIGFNLKQKRAGN